MEEPLRIFQVSRHPRKSGSGRQTTRRSFALTVRLGDSLTFSRQRENSGESVDGCASLATSSAAGGVSPKAGVIICPGPPQPNVCGQVPSQSVPNVEVENNLDMPGSLGYRHRVKVTAVRRTGSGRRTTPRAFPLTVALPEIRRTLVPSPLEPTKSPTPSSETPALQQQTDLGLQHNATAVELRAGELHSLPLQLPNIYELVKLALEVASSKGEKMHGAETPAAASPVQKACAVAMEVERVGSGLAVIAQPSTVITAMLNKLQSMQTPPTGRAVNILLRAESLQRNERHGLTPEEGMPESLYWSGPLSNNAISAWHQSAALESKQPEADCSMSPLEGIPERPMKRRRRVSVVPQAQWSLAVAHNGSHPNIPECKEGPARTPDPIPGSHELSWEDVLASLPDESSPQDGGVAMAEVPNDMLPCLNELNVSAAEVVAAMPAVLHGLVETAVSSMASDEPAVISTSPYGVSPGSHIPAKTGKNVTDEKSSAPSNMLGDTAREGLTAAAFSGQTAMQRFKATFYPSIPDVPDAATLTRSISCPSTSALSQPSPTSSHGTPAVVKIQNLREAIEGVMKRMAENLGGMPSCHAAQSLPHSSGLPPRPPSTSSRVAAADGISLPDTSDRSIIRRAPTGTLVFPSRTPSPMCDLKWPSALGEPALQFALGRVSGADTVTPPLGVTCGPFTSGNDTTATAATGTNGGTAHVNVSRRGAVVGPMVVETATSPFTDGDLQSAESAPDKSAAFASPFSADACSDTQESEGNAGESLASLPDLNLVRHGRESMEHAQGTNTVEGCPDTIERRDSGDPEPSKREGSGLSVDVAEQSSSESAGTSAEEVLESTRSASVEAWSEDSLEPSDSQNVKMRRDESEERSSGDSPQYSGRDLEPGVRGFMGGTEETHPGDCQQYTRGRRVPPACPDIDELDPAKMLASALRHDCGYKMNHDDDDNDLAIEEVMALPHPTDDPKPGRWDKAEAAVNRNSGSCARGQSARAQGRQATATAVLGVTAPSAAGPAAAISAPAAAGAPGNKAAVQPSQSNVRLKRKMSNRKSLAGSGLGLAMDENGTRRSTRSRLRPLEYWRGEGKSYGRDHNTMPTVKSILVRTPEPQWPLPSGKAGKAKSMARAKEKACEAATAVDSCREVMSFL